MSTLQKTQPVYLTAKNFQNAFAFNNINNYDNFIYSCYPNEYFMNVNNGEYERFVIDNIIKKVADACTKNKKNKLNETDSNKIINDAINAKPSLYSQVDKNNIQTILDAIGSTEITNSLLRAMTSNLKVGEDNNPDIKENFGIKNKANSEKYKIVYKLHIRLATFMLSLLHDLYWHQYTINEPNNENVNNILSGKNIDSCYETVIRASKEL
jgi:hypothetical protein